MQGLQGLQFSDNANGSVKGLQEDAALSVAGEVDKIFIQTPSQLKAGPALPVASCQLAAACCSTQLCRIGAPALLPQP